VGIAEAMFPLERRLLKRQRWERSPLSIKSMYAIAPGIIYHIVISDHYRRTLCGLYVVGDLEMIEEKPEDRILCLYCERIAAEKLKPKA